MWPARSRPSGAWTSGLLYSTETRIGPIPWVTLQYWLSPLGGRVMSLAATALAIDRSAPAASAVMRREACGMIPPRGCPVGRRGHLARARGLKLAHGEGPQASANRRAAGAGSPAGQAAACRP